MVPVSECGGPLAFASPLAVRRLPGRTVCGASKGGKAGLVCRACLTATASDDGLTALQMDFIFERRFRAVLSCSPTYSEDNNLTIPAGRKSPMTIARLRDFVTAMTRLVEHDGNAETAVLSPARDLLAGLVARDDWLPERFAAADPVKYRQYLLYGDPLDRFSLVSFVWGPGQRTPVHDHLMWGLVGMLRGVEEATVFTARSSGSSFGTIASATNSPGTTSAGTSFGTLFGTSFGLEASEPHALRPGKVTAVSPRLGDIHVVANALADRPSISIHLYGGNIGTMRRHCFDPATGAVSEFVSGYSGDDVPCLWARG